MFARRLLDVCSMFARCLLDRINRVLETQRAAILLQNLQTLFRGNFCKYFVCLAEIKHRLVSVWAVHQGPTVCWNYRLSTFLRTERQITKSRSKRGRHTGHWSGRRRWASREIDRTQRDDS